MRTTRCGSRGSPATWCSSITSAQRTAGRRTKDRAKCSLGWPTGYAWPTARQQSGDGWMTTTGSPSAGSAISDPLTVSPFAVISGAQVQRALQGQEKDIVELVEATYRARRRGFGESAVLLPAVPR